MARLTTLALALFLLGWPAARADHDQHIDLASGLNYVAIMVESGSNTLAELFPAAPAGLLVFKFDNARGYSVSQLHSNGWSDPGMTLHPSETAIILPPAGQEPHFHLEGHREYPLPAIYQGWNLIPLRSLFPLPPLTEKIAPRHLDEIWAPLGNGAFSLATYNADFQIWQNLRLPAEGAVWYRAASGWPTNPAGTAELRGTVYLNNYAPAFGLDEPLLDTNGCALDGSATLVRQEGDGSWSPIGASVSVRMGYIEPSQNLLREIVGDELASNRLAIAFTSAQGETRTEAAIVYPWKGLFPVGLNGAAFPDRPMFLEHPESMLAEEGAAAELRARFHYRTGPAPGSFSLASVESCACPVAYQWQRHSEGDVWRDVPDATTPDLRIASLSPGDYGRYRLTAAWGCRVEQSATAAILPPARILARRLEAESAFELTLTVGGMKRAELHISNDLETWQPYATDTQPEGDWVIRVPNTATKVFFRCVAFVR